MNKVGRIIGCIWPMVAAYLCQLLISAFGMAVYSMVIVFRAASNGVESPEELADYMLGNVLNADVVLLLGGIAIAGTLLMGALWYKKYRPKEHLSLKEVINRRLICVAVLLGLALQLLISLCLNAIYPILPGSMVTEYSELMESLIGGNTVLSVIITVLLAPLAEEFIFRGVILQKAKKFLPFMAANAVQALLFGIYHGNLIQGAYAFVIGMIFGYVTEYFHSVWAAILLHACLNGSAQLLSLLPETVTGNLFGYFALAFVGVLFLVAAGKLFKKARTELPEPLEAEENKKFTENSFDEYNV
ncbi:MAG: lysostaphin resistance A-like protein [Lachnospiraceae bacterium]